jgi:hypothetical protein
MTDEQRLLLSYEFEGGGYIHVTVNAKTDSTEALEMLEKLIAIKREEIAKNDGK